MYALTMSGRYFVLKHILKATFFWQYWLCPRAFICRSHNVFS